MPPSARRRVFPPDPLQRASSPPRPSGPIQPPPGEYAIAALERAKQCLARTGFVAVLAARADPDREGPL